MYLNWKSDKYYNNFKHATRNLVVFGAVIMMIFLSGCKTSVGSRQRPLLRVANKGGKIQFSIDKQINKSSSTGVSTKQDSTIMREQLDLFAKGNVYDARFMSYLAAIGFGLTQQDYKTNTD